MPTIGRIHRLREQKKRHAREQERQTARGKYPLNNLIAVARYPAEKLSPTVSMPPGTMRLRETHQFGTVQTQYCCARPQGGGHQLQKKTPAHQTLAALAICDPPPPPPPMDNRE